MSQISTLSQPKLWRLHIRPTSTGDGDYKKVVGYCIENRVAGIGWGVDAVHDLEPEEYIDKAYQKYKKKVAAVNFVKDVAVNDLIWTRGKNNIYYLGRVMGNWRYVRSSPSVELDIPNQRPCDWYEIGTQEKVPGKIVSCFRPTRALQKIEGKSMLDFSCDLYNQMSLTDHYPDTPKVRAEHSADEFFTHIGDQECEDVVGLFLQYKCGYLIVPSTCKRDTAAYEFVLMHPQKGQAVVQVKQGDISIENIWPESVDRVFLFSTKGVVPVVENERVVRLDKQEMFSFVKENQHIMPYKILYWLNRKYL